MVATGCGDASDATATPRPTEAAASPATAGPSTSEPGGSGEPTSTDEPPATDEPTDTPASDEPSSTAGSGPAAACAGNDDNRDFYAAVADAVEWTVYCPVLGPGWFVDAGTYRLAGGGWMEITYQGPDGATLELRAGSICEREDCEPGGSEAGDVAFGDRTGTMFVDDEISVVVDAGETPTWILTMRGVDADTVEAVAGDLVRVGS